MANPERKYFPEIDYTVVGVLTTVGLSLIISNKLELMLAGAGVLGVAIQHYRWTRGQRGTNV